MNASKWSVDWWKGRHEKGYFPTMDQHKDWRVHDHVPPSLCPLVAEWPSTDEWGGRRMLGLEIGCGYGQWMVPIADEFPDVYLVGVDISPVLAEKAKETFSAHRLSDRCSFLLGDGLTLPVESGIFDFVYSVSVFQHMPRATVAGYFDEAVRVLKPHGQLSFHFRRDDGVGEYSKDIGVNHRGDFSTGWSADDIVREADRVGLTNCQISWDRVHSIYLIATTPG